MSKSAPTMTSSSKLIYIAGPYTAPHYREVQANIERAREVAMYLATHRVPYICPHLNSAHFDDIIPEVPYDHWLSMYMLVLRKCDALLTIEGWRRSRGAALEVQFAEEQGLLVFHDKRQLVRWVRGQV